jgi:hypothetical protein
MIWWLSQTAAAAAPGFEPSIPKTPTVGASPS